MKYKLKVLFTFAKEAKRLGKRYPSLKEDVNELGREILVTPPPGHRPWWWLAQDTHGHHLHLLTIYDKAERDSISKEELKELLQKNGLA